ncbi:MAG: threonine/serine exporter family protein [Fibrobacteraceae bacterium]|nr:threonine/serine exporter family protein [Fibrobacteraceae bacterium]
MIALDILLDGTFAAIAAIGFGAISDPPKRAYPRIAILAAIGHALRYSLMHYADMDIATASLISSFAIGMGSLGLGRRARCPLPVLYIPALLPMIPGIYAYRTIFYLVMFLQALNEPSTGVNYMQQFLSNGIVTIGVVSMLAVGATSPFFIFKHRAFSLTRKQAPKQKNE